MNLGPKKKQFFILFLFITLFATTIVGVKTITKNGIFAPVEVTTHLNSQVKNNSLTVYRKSVKNYFEAFPSKRGSKNEWISNRGSIKNIIIGISPQELVKLDHIKISILKKEQTYSRQEFIKDWLKVPAPSIPNIKPGLLFYQAPPLVQAESFLNNLTPLVNWGINWGLSSIILFFIALALISFLSIFIIRNYSRNYLKFPINNKFYYLFSFLGLIYSYILISQYGVHLFWMDQLELVYLLQAKETQTLNFHLFWMQHNEHRILTTRLLFYLLSFIKPFNNHLMSFFGQFCLFISSLFIIREILNHSKVELSRGLRGLMCLVSAMLIFSIVHIENTILPFHTQWHFSFLGLTLTCVGLAQKNKYQTSIFFWIGIMIGFFSSPSWILILPLVFFFRLYKLLEEREISHFEIIKKEILYYLAFSFIFGLLLILYFYDWNSVSQISSFQNPKKFLKFFFSILGNQVPHAKLAFPLGVLFFIIANSILIFNIVKKQIIHNNLFIIFLLATQGLAVMTSIGRSSTGIAELSRYANLSTPGWIALFCILFSNFPKLRPQYKVFIHFSFSAFFCLQLIYGTYMGRSFKMTLQEDLLVIKESFLKNDSSFLFHSKIHPGIEHKQKRDYIFNLYQWMIKNEYFLLRGPSKSKRSEGS